MFIPLGTEQPTTLQGALKTADDGVHVAETYNKLEWEVHQGLGADSMIAVGRKGSFILAPVMR